MPNMKKFLDPVTLTRKLLMIAGIAFCAVMILTFLVVMIRSQVPLFMLAIPTFPFVLAALFLSFVLRKGMNHYSKWWNSLSPAEQSDIEQDYRNAWQADQSLILGEHYAYIRQLGEALAFDDIDDVYFRRARGLRWNMFIILCNGQMRVAQLPAFVNREAIWEEIMQRCKNDQMETDA